MSYQLNAYQPIAFQQPGALVINPGAITDVYTYFSPDIGFMIEEAFERAGVSPQAIDNEKMYSCMRSVQLMLNSEWLNYGIRQWMVKQNTETLTAGDNVFDMPEGTVDLINMITRLNGSDVPMTAMSRQEYTELAVKTTQGRPNRFFVEKNYNQVRVFVWPVPNQNIDIAYDYLQTAADAGTASNVLEMAPAAIECFISGLAMRLALKFNIERYNLLKEDYGGPGYPSVVRGKIFQMRATTGERVSVSHNLRPR